MAIRQITRYGEPVLRNECEPVGEIDEEVKQLVQDMFDTLHRSKGLGLAAPQVGVNLKICIIDLTQIDFDAEPLVLINPEILENKGEIIGEEGCLSFPGLYFDVHRAERVTVEYQDVDGNHKRVTAYGMAARAIQHETDHLKGVLFIDYLSATERDLYAGKLRKIKVG
jgi:peptide deformylase